MRRKLRTWALYLKEHFLEYPAPNLEGTRDVENSWIAAQMPEGPGYALDFGCGTSSLGLLAARRNFIVTAIDPCPILHPFSHERFTFYTKDLLSTTLPPVFFSLIINCSSVEHVGLERYGSRKVEDGDIFAMRKLWGITKVGGIMLLTTVVGRECTVANLHRVYGKERLDRLLQGWRILNSEWWTKNERNQWVESGEAAAFAVEPSDHYYGLFLAKLQKDKAGFGEVE